MFQGWITPFIDPVAEDAAVRLSALLLPVVLATLAVYAARLMAPAKGNTRSAVVEFDRQRLGDRRFSSARLWFAAFATQTAAAAGIETHLEGDDVLDLELIAIQETMLRATPATVLGDDLEALEWLTGHFRREMLHEESESLDRPALSSCWIAFGSVSTSASLLGARGVVQLRLVNAADLGQEAFIDMEWRGRRGLIGRHRRPLVGLVREPDPALLGDRISRIPLRIDGIGGALDAGRQGLGHRLLTSAQSGDVEGSLTDEFVGVAQAARLTIADTWGDQWWTTAPGFDLGSRASATVRCQLFTEAEPLRLRQARVADRNSAGART